MTQLTDAKKGILTEEMKTVAQKEGVSEEFILNSVKNGTIAIPKNINHDIEASGIGAGLKTKVNATVGTSTDIVNFDEEVYKAQVAIDNGTKYWWRPRRNQKKSTQNEPTTSRKRTNLPSSNRINKRTRFRNLHGRRPNVQNHRKTSKRRNRLHGYPL